jgi:hypothetical protein
VQRRASPDVDRERIGPRVEEDAHDIDHHSRWILGRVIRTHGDDGNASQGQEGPSVMTFAGAVRLRQPGEKIVHLATVLYDSLGDKPAV